MSNDVYWHSGTFLLLLANVLILCEFEFRACFERRVYGLRPTDFKKDVYSKLLADILDYGSIKRAQGYYVSISLLILISVSGFITCSMPIREMVAQLFPPVLFGILDKIQDKSCYPKSFFYHLLFFTFCFHALPIMAILLDPLSSKKKQKSNSVEERALKVLTALFSAQQYYLNRSISRLLRDRVDISIAEASNRGSLTGRIKARVAAEIVNDIDEESIRAEYGNCNELHEVSDLGKGASAVRCEGEAEPSLHNIANKFIEYFGIPDVQSRFKWRINRKSTRKYTSLRAAAKIDSVEIKDAWIENLGKDLEHKKCWNSILLKVKQPSLELLNAMKNNIHLLITQLGDRPLDDEAIGFKIVRMDQNEEEATLYLGAVVVDDRQRQFNRLLRLVHIGAN